MADTSLNAENSLVGNSLQKRIFFSYYFKAQDITEQMITDFMVHNKPIFRQL